MKKLSSSRSELLLMEIILAILFFSLASAVCLQLFVKASLLSRDTRELDLAVRCAVSTAELLNEAGDPLEQIMTVFPESYILTEEGITLLFDEEFHSCTSADMAYQMDIISTLEDDRTASWSVVIYRENHSAEIYRLEGTSYRPLTPSVPTQKGGAGAA